MVVEITRYSIIDEDNRLIRHQIGKVPAPEYYDVKSKKWVVDDNLMVIYLGDIATTVITESCANMIIDRYGWKD